jgi:metallo-beta-lactamase class B
MKSAKLVFSLLIILPGFKTFSHDQREQKISIFPITKNIYVHQSYKHLDGKPFPSNGLIINTSDDVVLVDAAWNNSQTQELLNWIKSNLREKVVLAIITHSHDDRIGGITVLKTAGVKVISTALTADRAVKDSFPRPESIIPMKASSFIIGKTEIETFYPGKRHAPDNFVVWLPDAKVLFGGCLVKSTESAELGNIADASLAEWPITIQKLIDKYGDVNFIDPRHHGWKGDPLKHTLELLRNNGTQ